MLKPFEGLFGNNCELRTLEYLLPLEGLEFNVTELAEEVGISRPSATKTIKIFLEWGLIKSRKQGENYYSINYESPIVKNILQLNNLLIEKMLGDDVLYEIHDYLESKKPLSGTADATNSLEMRSNVPNCVTYNQSLIKETDLWKERPIIKHHKFYSNNEEKPISKLYNPGVAT